ncbi:MAG: hypothetical protein A4E72_00162 [Syntrophus sp. PtaU1.Bin208]|nr:MAG: hypothetical protein A4E72_00162 [Syntrophus sp. PtaU1.Bin208]
MVEVAGFFPEIHFQNLRSHDHVIAALQMLLLFPVFNQGPQEGALGMEDDQSRPRLFTDLEKIEISSQLPVVPFLGLFDDLEIILQVVPGGETGPVDSLQHLVPLVPAPVSAGDIEEFEGADHGGRGDVRPPAEIGVAALSVKADGFHFRRQVFQELDLIRFSLALEKGDGFLAGNLFPDKRMICFDNLLHPVLYFFKILQSEGISIFKIIIKAIFNGRTDTDQHSREKILNGLGHYMGNAVTKDFQTFA